jgi:hypothetical protein
MSNSVHVEDRTVLTAVARLLIEGADLIAFKYDSGFTIHFQHEMSRAESALPVQVSLVLRAPWSPGEVDGVPSNLTVADLSRIRCRPEQPYQAFSLMTLLGQKVEHVEIAANGSMTLGFSSAGKIRIAGVEKEWDFSWYLFVPSDFPGVDTWSINCDATGNLEGCWPAEANIPASST